MPNIIRVSPYETLITIEICSSAARYIRLTSFYKWFSAVGLQKDFLLLWEDWSRFVLITGGTKKGHFWMQRIAEIVGEFLKGDWGRSRLITGGNIGGHYCTPIMGRLIYATIWWNPTIEVQQTISKWIFVIGVRRNGPSHNPLLRVNRV